MSDVKTFYPAAGRSSPWTTIIIVISALAAFLPLFMYAYYGTAQRSLSLTVDPSGLNVKFGLGSISIPADEIAGVTLVESPGSLGRVAGAALRGLQMGWYRLEDYGRVYRLTTGGRPLVYVDTAAGAQRARPDTRYVFSPEDAEGFTALLQSVAGGRSTSAGGSGPAEATFRSAPAKSVLGDPVMIFAILITLPIGIFMPILVRRGRLGMRYEVGPEGIRVHHLGAKSYRWGSIRSVRMLDAPIPKMIRIMGAGLPGYFAGHFRAAELGGIQVYATRLEPPVILLETGVSKVLISPEDIHGFLEAADGFMEADGKDEDKAEERVKPLDNV